MLKSRFLRVLIVLIVVAVGATFVVRAASIGPFSHDVPVTPPVLIPLTPMREVHPATAADEAKGIFSGPIGEFVITPRKQAAYPPCPQPIRRTQNYKGSELYSPVFGDNLKVYECGNGKIMNIALIGGPAMGRGYFVGPAILPWEGPFDRLKLLTVGGHSAIAQLPHPAFPDSARLAVIERFPAGNENPGILVWVDNASSIEKAAVLAAEIIGVPR